MSRFEQHGGFVQPDPGRSGRRPKPSKGWERPDVARPGTRHPRREAVRAALAQVATAEVQS